MKVLLVYPNLHGMNMLPPAISLFTRLLRMNGHAVDLFDTTDFPIPGEETYNSDIDKVKLLTARPFDDTLLKCSVRSSVNVFEGFREKINTFGPDLIAVSVTEDIFPVAVRLLEHLDRHDIPVIMGGVFATFAPEKCLALKAVDMVCIGEGEHALVELCDRLSKGKACFDIENIWIKQNGSIKKNKLGPPVNIDENPLPDLSLFEESRLYRPMQGKVWRMLPVETHRGCPYQCTYCNSPAQQRLYRNETHCNHYRKKSLDAIYRELIYFKEVMKAEAFYFWADTFFCYREDEFDAFCEMYADIRLPFWCQTRPETIKENRVKKLIGLGLFRMAFGIEHGNPNFRKHILRRNIDDKTMIHAGGILNQLGIPFSVNNIIGFPTETRSLAMDTVLLNRQINSDDANAYSFSPFHGTPLREMAEKQGCIAHGLVARSATRETLLTMPQFPPDEIEGFRRCFTLYVKMPEARWKDIKRAEKLTDQGNKIWSDLIEECRVKYLNY